MTNSVTVAMTIRGRVKYEMRLLLNHCQGENPMTCGPEERGGLCEAVELVFFMKESGKNRPLCGTTQDWSLSCKSPEVEAIAEAARELVRQRDKWLNPPDAAPEALAKLT